MRYAMISAQFGTPFKKPQLRLTSCEELHKDGAMCYHPEPHPEKLVGSTARQSAPYPKELCNIIVHAFDCQLNTAGPPAHALRKTASWLVSHLFGSVDAPGKSALANPNT